MNLCACGAPLLARYRLEEAAAALDRDQLEGQTLWRYHAMLPVQSPAGVVSLGEGMTPLLRAERLGKRLGLNHLYIKDESLNRLAPLARGPYFGDCACCGTGVTWVAIPSAYNVYGATAAYAARAGLGASLHATRCATRLIIECQINGAHVELVDGLI
jgi:threonine synthase